MFGFLGSLLISFSSASSGTASTGLNQIEPYVGYHMSLSPSRRSVENNEVKNSRERFFRIGLPFKYMDLEDYGLAHSKLVFWPEITIGDRLVGFSLGAGPEQEIFKGPRHQPLYLVVGAQAGLLYLYLHSTGGYGSGVKDLTETRYAGIERNTIAAVLNFYFGPKFTFGDSFAGKILINSQLSAGKLIPNTFQAPFGNIFGLTMGLNLQLEF